MIKKIKILIETALFVGVFHLIRLMGLKRGNRLFGKLFTALGRHTKLHKKAKSNIAMIYKDKTSNEVEAIALEVWRQLGCMMNEFFHSEKIRDPKKVTFENIDVFAKAKEEGRGVILTGGHFSNIDMLIYFMEYMEEDGIVFMRRFNHTGVFNLLHSRRVNFGGDIEYCAKSNLVARYLSKELSKGRSVMFLSDQRKVSGLETTFLGQPAKSPAGVASLAWRRDIPIVIWSISRDRNDHFTVRMEERLAWVKSGDKAKDISAITQQINDSLGKIIHRDPTQWFWLHDRWKVKHKAQKA